MENQVQQENFTHDLIKIYDERRHIPLEEAYELIKSEALNKSKLEEAISSKQIHTYEFDGKKFLDRIDIGRVYEPEYKEPEGLTIERYFTKKGEDSLESQEYEMKHLEILNANGKPIFEMDAEFPVSWDNDSAKIVAQKYFFKPSKQQWKEKLIEKIKTPGENSIKHLVKRVANFVTDSGDKYKYFKTKEDREAFRDELTWLMINRAGAFNSPVEFNAGIYNEYGVEGNNNTNKYYKNPETKKAEKIKAGEYVYPQCHACFIKGPRDDLESILHHGEEEGSVFSSGSGIGQNISNLREEGAPLSGGGKSSGPMSFLKIYDVGASSIKSGGKTRRAARMTIMDQDHPDIMKFIRAKTQEDKKALSLMKSGFSSGMDGESYSTVAFQNSNFSVRLDDEFFKQLEKKGKIKLRSVKTKEVVKEIPAEEMLKEIAFGAWRVGDPGVQYSGEINKMHTCPNSGKQYSSNPCGEYLFLDDTSCNLASLNLLKFSDEKGHFNAESFERASRIFAISQDIINQAASYPVKDIAEISPEFGSIGLGFSNLGNLIMRRGIEYDSDEARALTGVISAILTGSAYKTSTELAEKIRPFVHYNLNKKPMLNVIKEHKKSLENILWDKIPEKELKEQAFSLWEEVLERGKKYGFKNAQVSMIAPTGTISYLLGSQSSTGIEPPISLVIYKNLTGGGSLKIVNQEVTNALKNLGYSNKQIKDITDYITEDVSGRPRSTVIRAPHLNPDHYPIFNTAFGNSNGEGSISPEGHLKIVSAAQPFITGGISKTINLPNKATVKDIYDLFLLGYKEKVKGVTAFRTNSKANSVLNFGKKEIEELKRGEKRDLPLKRTAYEWEVEIKNTPFHLLVSEYKDGTPGQIVILSYKAGSSLGTLLEITGIQTSKALRRGVKLEDLVSSWIGQSFEPKGQVYGYPYITKASSPLDLIGRILLIEYEKKLDLAKDPKKVRIEELRGAKSGAFETLEAKKINEWNIYDVLKSPKLGGFSKKNEDDNGKINNFYLSLPGLPGFKEEEPDKEEKVDDEIKTNEPDEQDGDSVICPECGHPMRKTDSNCYFCDNCGNKIGGCGL